MSTRYDREQRARDAVVRDPYLWDEDRGICVVGKDGVDRQAVQIMHGPASMAFREKCGRILVDALNREMRREMRLAKIQKERKPK